MRHRRRMSPSIRRRRVEAGAGRGPPWDEFPPPEGARARSGEEEISGRSAGARPVDSEDVRKEGLPASAGPDPMDQELPSRGEPPPAPRTLEPRAGHQPV